MKMAALCDIDTAVGFRLAGIQDLFVPKDNVKELWNKICERDDIGILFITERIAEVLGKYLKEFRVSHDTPIIVEIPDKKGKMKDHVNFISQLIKKAVGVEIG